ncbi:PIN/TRAM domain-containing protein [Acetohalobium arabaticum]|uniref:PilT protein domain protein n=1 Tax=Acetohalobium arabaticum (strain ATCC 49924 / DSM 5501 / Z-7288) TaxID=574087 RepID=D9QSZ8_ACEAZ|nr:PIN/TRAM domain-containing protein [Acetohalobium arabaticum]ADL11686.1 PilT protein domain protein [Acetohalobium arabaticum DSM 5501]
MLKRIWRGICTILGAVVGYQIIEVLGLAEKFDFSLNTIDQLLTSNQIYGIVIGGIIGYLLLPVAVERLFQIILNFEDKLERIPFQDIVAGIAGLIIGLIIGILLIFAFPLSSIPQFGLSLQVLVNLVLGYLGVNLAIKKREEFFRLFENLPNIFNKDKILSSSDQEENQESTPPCKILDTSVIIDGRIADICQTDFIDGVFVIPEFVLEELQHIADSSDILKRNRGRRGLEILNKMQKELDVPVEIYEGDFEDIDEVDSKLVKLAKLLGGKVITNDYNLNKVSELQGVSVLNINELANAVKPVVLPGEEMTVEIIKEGKEPGQGVGYLDDGTMIVVDDGKQNIGDEIDVLVTSVLQTAAGRMIFAKPKAAEQAL